MQSRPAPSPLSIPSQRQSTDVEEPIRIAECLPCAASTPHVLGMATYGPDGELLVQWWKCTRCPEGEAV